MANVGFRPYKENENVKGPIVYVSETKECICGWCGQVIVPKHNNETPETHFKRCKNSRDNGLIRVFINQRRVQQSLKILNEKLYTMKTEVMEEIKADHIRMKTEFNNEILAVKAEIKVELETLKKVIREENDGAYLAFNNQLIVLENGMEKKMRELRAAQEKQMAEVNGRFTGVTETISTVVHSALEEVREKSLADTNELAPLKKDVEALSERVKSNGRDLQVVKRQLENQVATDEATKKKQRFHVEPSPSHQLKIPMNCFNLVTRNSLFQPSFKWTIVRIKSILTQKTFELSSEWFQWNGYPVQARAKLQLKEDDYVHVSLQLNNVRNDESSQQKIFAPIPTVFYLLKDKYRNLRNAKQACKSSGYLPGATFSYSLAFNQFLVPKSWFHHSTYKVADSVELEIYVEPPPMTQEVHSYDGTLEWNMENYARRLQLQKDGCVPYQESASFYTGPRGYRVQVAIFLNGNEGEAMTARVLFVTGKFDAELSMSFAHSTTVILIKRKEPGRAIAKTVVEDMQNNKYYDFEICKVEEMETLVENDALIFNVSIEEQ